MRQGEVITVAGYGTFKAALPKAGVINLCIGCAAQFNSVLCDKLQPCREGEGPEAVELIFRKVDDAVCSSGGRK